MSELSASEHAPLLRRGVLSNLGIHIYGLAAIALGLIGLIWGDFATYWQIVPATVPHRHVLAYLAGLCLLLAGAAMEWRRSAQAGAWVLSLAYLIFALLWLPRVIGFPQLYGTWNGFAEEFAFMAAGLVAYALAGPRRSVWRARTAQTGRYLFGLCAVSFGIEHFTAIPQTVDMIPKWLPPGPRFWALFTGAAFLLAGAAILCGMQALLACRLLTGMFVAFGLLVWAPSAFAHPREHMVWAGNAINLAAIGAAWVVADFLQAARDRLEA